MNLQRSLLIFMISGIFMSCKKAPQAETEVYRNTFEQADMTGIVGGSTDEYNGTRVMGRYNNSGFSLELEDLPAHDVIRIAFDLYIHDSWAGNNTGNASVIDGPDLWRMDVDGKTFINTTFSYSACGSTFCQQQSFPRNYPFHHDPGTGAFRKDLPGVCSLSGVAGGTSLYRIERVIEHKNSWVEIEFKDMLKQSNAIDPLCDESWSMDNLVVSTAVLK